MAVLHSPSDRVLICLVVFMLTCMNCWSMVNGDDERCQEITIPMCKGIGYNHTYMPNQFNHETQEEAGLEVHQFWPLVEIQCSPDLKLFLCSMYTPICMPKYTKPLPACRSLCKRAKSGCAPIMAQYGFQWPKRMNCDNLPMYGTGVCMDPNSTENSTSTPKPNMPTQRPTNSKNHDGKPNRKHSYNMPEIPNKPFLPDGKDFPNKPFLPNGKDFPGKSYLPNGKDFRGKSFLPDGKDFHGIPGIFSEECMCKCRMVPLSKSSSYFNKLSTGGIPNCALNCTSPYFTPDEMIFTTFWIGLWSILCCIATAMTVLTFFVDMQRFKYPERPIVFLSGCYFMVSVGYIIRLIVGHEAVACDGNTIRYETTGPALCTVVFLLIYFFGMASSIWWVILSFTWFLSAGLKWGQEAIASYSQYFHLAAWLVPSVKSIAVLAMSSVDGDAISGICYVGNQNLNNLRGFVIAPLFVYLLLGTSFLLAGFVSLFRIRNVIKQQGRGTTDKLEKLMIRIGVFSVLYTVPATIVIGCYFYEQHLKVKWEVSKNCPCSEPSWKPDYSVFMLKYFMCLVVGITSGFWIWTGKTLQSWRKLFNCCRKNNDSFNSRHTKSTNVSYPGVKAVPLSQV